MAKDNTSCVLRSLRKDAYLGVTPLLEKYEACLLLLVGIAGLSILLAIIHKMIRKYVYHDDNSLDTVFDAGGRVSFGLTSVTVMSQMLWPADFLQSATLMSKTGLGGSIYYSFGVVLAIVLFPLLSIRLKTIAPGAKTYLQIVYARFGKPAHILYCCIALSVNLIIILALVLAAKAVIETIAKDMSRELIVLIIAVLFGSYCVVGGLGTTFYVSYFTTAMTFISVVVFVVSVFYFDNDKVPSMDKMYEALSCLDGPQGNLEGSYMTFVSQSGVIYGIVIFLMTTALNFLDQGNWQSRIAAKPSQAVGGFLVAAFLWSGIPTTISLTTTMTYLTLSYENGTQLLSPDDIESGYITPYVMQYTMGKTGAYLLLLMTTMALMSTGSGEIMAIASIIVYDIYRVYINPFRKVTRFTDCVLCGKIKTSANTSDDVACICSTAKDCMTCAKDDKVIENVEGRCNISSNCTTHGSYRKYEELLLRHKSWCLVWITIAIIPYGLLILYSDINLTWGMFFLETLLSAFILPLLLCFTWVKCTSTGIIFGSICGLIASIVAILVVGEVVFEEGLRNFFQNTSADYSLMAGVAAGVSVSTFVTIITSLCTHQIKSEKDAQHVWERTLHIDNPLSPWRDLYKKELSRVQKTDAVTINHMKFIFRKTRILALVGGAFSIIIFIAVIPSIALSFKVLSFKQFTDWLTMGQVWVMVGATFAVLVPPIQEIYIIKREYSKEKK